MQIISISKTVILGWETSDTNNNGAHTENESVFSHAATQVRWSSRKQINCAPMTGFEK